MTRHYVMLYLILAEAAANDIGVKFILAIIIVL